MGKWSYIKKISKISDQYGNKLIAMMEKYNKQNLREVTCEEVKEYYEKLKEKKEK